MGELESDPHSCLFILLFLLVLIGEDYYLVQFASTSDAEAVHVMR